MKILPNELEAQVVVPALRSALAKKLSDKGLKQKEIAGKLHLTQAAISQYINHKRAKIKDRFTPSIEKEIDITVERLQDCTQDLVGAAEILRLCNKVKQDPSFCKLHMSVDDEVPKDCKICFEKHELVQL